MRHVFFMVTPKNASGVVVNVKRQHEHEEAYKHIGEDGYVTAATRAAVMIHEFYNPTSLASSECSWLDEGLTWSRIVCFFLASQTFNLNYIRGVLAPEFGPLNSSNLKIY